MPRLLELDLARACTDLLELDGWRALRTDPVSDDRRGKGFGEIGMADYLYLRYGFWNEVRRANGIAPNSPNLATCEAMWIEWKIPTGRASPLQRAWHEQERVRGALTLIAGVDFHASIEGFARWYSQSGLQRRKLRLQGERKMA